MRKLLAAIWLVSAFLAYSQPAEKPIYFETNVLPTDNGNICYISYKVPFKNLFFVKGEKQYSSGLRVTLEGKSVKNDSEIFRKSSARNVTAKDYQTTESKNVFVEGLLRFSLSKGKYKFTPVIDLYNTDNSYKLKPFEIKVDSIGPGVIKPVIVDDEQVACENNKVWTLPNYENSIPFSNEQYTLLIPIYKEKPGEIIVSILQNDSTVFQQTLNSAMTGIPKVVMCENSVAVGIEEFEDYRVFGLEKFNYNLEYGKADVKVEFNDKSKTFTYPVKWFNKPRSLNNIDLAVKLLKQFHNDGNVSEIYEAPDEKRFKALLDYWKKYDQTPETGFNEVMNEFYSRVDFAAEEYQTADNTPGYKTDRGEIYIKYGKPDTIKRTYSKKYNAVEIWKYDKLNKKFYFADRSGLGEYKLLD